MAADSSKKFQVVSISNRGEKTLEVAKNDVFIATAWWTAYTIMPVIKWQAKNYNQKEKSLIYFIQDYEPYFHAWSSKYCYSESTYNMDNKMIAVFNSNELMEYFHLKKYTFYKEYCFNPIMPDSLKQKLSSFNDGNRKKQIIFYGRPSVARNAFEIIINSLEMAFSNRNDADEWKIFSVGEKHDDIYINDKIMIKSLGKLSLDEYANLMNESYVGISLMISPHPSYPPLEMSTFGVKTITNCFENKDLSYFNKNIISVKNCNPACIAKEITKVCDNYNGKAQKDFYENYINSENEFIKIVREISKTIK